MKTNSFYFLLSYFFLLFSLTMKADIIERPLKTIKTTLIFSKRIATPNHLTLCDEKLWTFSESKQKLIVLSISSGNILSELSLSEENAETGKDIAAITCRKSQIYLLVNERNKSFIQKIIINKNGVSLSKSYLIPGSDRASDFFCNENQCFALKEDLYQTNDLIHWRKELSPKLSETPKTFSQKSTNPFEDWQSSLHLARNKYSRGLINKDSELVLLDPFQMQFAIKLQQKNWQKWGHFGAWEGSFLSPKVLTFISKENIAIADNKLKAIFIFKKQGNYVGVLATDDNKILSLDYPLGMDSDGKTLFIADFRGDQIIALKLQDQKESSLHSSPEIMIRKNLFRREEVLKDQPSSQCLNCHDGMITNQLYKFVKLKNHHPLECSECHEPHHNLKNKHALKDKPYSLCLSCHQDYANKNTNHVWSHKKAGGNCIDCHASHTLHAKLLVKAPPQLCENCHKELAFSHKPTERLSVIDKANKIHLEGGNISCQTCHQTHLNWKDSHFVKPPESILTFCSSCHGDKSPELLKNFHKLTKPKKESLNHVEKK
ncbi:MAG: cytochrome c3 family protein [Bdellovibrionaceae bacterium]|nr:cytochrome c3 family protein [Pseudobdellovibrionaceae bacterium]